MLHAAAAVLALRGRRWLFRALLVSGRAVFLFVNGRPWLDIGGAEWPEGLPVVYGCVFAVLGAAQWLARPAPATAWELNEGDAGDGPA